MESNRIQKVNQLLQEELAELFNAEARKSRLGLLISITEVRTTPDLSLAKVYVSVFPTQYRAKLLDEIKANLPHYRLALGKKVGKSMRIVPQLQFYADDSLDRADQIEKELKGKGNNPIL